MFGPAEGTEADEKGGKLALDRKPIVCQEHPFADAHMAARLAQEMGI